MKKILVISVIIISIVIVGELFILSKIESMHSLKIQLMKEYSLSQLSEAQNSSGNLLDDSVIRYLQSRRQTDNHRFYLTEVLTGHISNVFYDSGEIGFIVVDSQNNRVLTFMRDPSSNTTYFRMEDDKKVKIDSNTIMVGEKITFTSYTDLVNAKELWAEIVVE